MAGNIPKSDRTFRVKTGRGTSLSLEFFDTEETEWLEKKIFGLLDRDEGEPVRSSHFATVLKFRDPQTGSEFFFKEYLDRGPLDRIRSLTGATRGRRAFEAGKLLLAKDHLTATPVAYGEEKLFFIVRRNFLITRGCEGKRTYEYLEDRFPLPLDSPLISEKRAMIRKTGNEIGRLHRQGIFHGDLRVGNILIRGEGASAELILIDNERTRSYRKIPERKMIKNLVQLNMVLSPHITRSDRLRFLNAYLEENHRVVHHRKNLIRKVQGITAKRHFSKAERMKRNDSLFPAIVRQERNEPDV